jgi:hypothetical protein
MNILYFALLHIKHISQCFILRYHKEIFRQPNFSVHHCFIEYRWPMYISIYLYTLIYKDIGKLESLHPCVPAPPAVASWGSWIQVRHAAHPQRGAPIVDRHDRILSGEGCHVTLVRDLAEFHASGERSQ